MNSRDNDKSSVLLQTISVEEPSLSVVEELIEAADSGQSSLGTLGVGDYIPQNSTIVS